MKILMHFITIFMVACLGSFVITRIIGTSTLALVLCFTWGFIVPVLVNKLGLLTEVPKDTE